MKYITGLIGIALTSTMWSVNSQAIPVSEKIPDSYGSATHDTTEWQELANAPDPYGVSWSVDGGLTWGHDVNLYVGQTVQFKFNMHKYHVGTHYADHLKAWVDWGHDGTFNQTTDVVAYAEHLLKTEELYNLGSDNIPNTPDFVDFSFSTYTLTDAHVGETWLRALVTCTHSILERHNIQYSWANQWNPMYTGKYNDLLEPTGHYYQGETEEWKLVVHTPEPATLLLLGVGLAGLASARLRAK